MYNIWSLSIEHKQTTGGPKLQGTWQILLGDLSPMVFVREGKLVLGDLNPIGMYKLVLGDLSPIGTPTENNKHA